MGDTNNSVIQTKNNDDLINNDLNILFNYIKELEKDNNSFEKDNESLKEKIKSLEEKIKSLLGHIHEISNIKNKNNFWTISQKSHSELIMEYIKQNSYHNRTKGCNCKKSKCLKKYCECFNASVLCSTQLCRCTSCKNISNQSIQQNLSIKENVYPNKKQKKEK